MIVSKIENKKRKADIIILSAAFLALLFVLLFSSLFSSMQKYYFNYAFERYGVYEKFGKEKSLMANNNILDFLDHKNKLDKDFLGVDEIRHLEDVRVILDKIKLIYYISLIIFFALLIMYRHELIKVSSLVFLILLSLIPVYFIFGFDFLFLKFHELFFTGNYAFDPRVSNMKALYPDALFTFFSLILYLKTILKSLILALSWKYLYSIKQE